MCAPERSRCTAVKLPDTAKGAVEQAAPAGQHRQAFQILPHQARQPIVDGRQAVEIIDQGPRRSADYPSALTEGQPLDVPPGFRVVKLLQQLWQGEPALEPDDRIKLRDRLKNFRGAQGGEMTARS